VAALSSSTNTIGAHRIDLVQKPEGVYVFIYERADSHFPERDYLDDDFDQARSRCFEDFGVPLEFWS